MLVVLGSRAAFPASAPAADGPGTLTIRGPEPGELTIRRPRLRNRTTHGPLLRLLRFRGPGPGEPHDPRPRPRAPARLNVRRPPGLKLPCAGFRHLKLGVGSPRFRRPAVALRWSGLRLQRFRSH